MDARESKNPLEKDQKSKRKQFQHDLTDFISEE